MHSIHNSSCMIYKLFCQPILFSKIMYSLSDSISQKRVILLVLLFHLLLSSRSCLTYSIWSAISISVTNNKIVSYKSRFSFFSYESSTIAFIQKNLSILKHKQELDFSEIFFFLNQSNYSFVNCVQNQKWNFF